MRELRRGERAELGDVEKAIAAVPAEVLGNTKLVVADTESGAHLRIPEDKVARIRRTDGIQLVAGPARIALHPGDHASLWFGDFEVEATAFGDEPRQPPPRRKVTGGAWLHTGIVAAVHAALLFAGSQAALASSIETDNSASLERIRGYLAASEERSAVSDPVVAGQAGAGAADTPRFTGHNGNGKAGGGERHSGEAGKAGSTSSRSTGKRWGVEGRSAESGADQDLEGARDFGMIGLLRSESRTARASGGTSPWGTQDAFTAAGEMWGRTLGEAAGRNGLSLSGIGEGGGGRGEGIGLGAIGTIGHTDGLAGMGTGGSGTLAQIGVGAIWGSWDSVSHLRASHRVRPIVCRCGETTVSGRLPPEAVQRVVRQNFGRFRACYQQGLTSNPALAGRVSTQFVIGRDGSVMSAVDGGSDLPDSSVRACVHRAFTGISFPQPEGGIVTVVYPIVFSNDSAK